MAGAEGRTHSRALEGTVPSTQTVQEIVPVSVDWGKKKKNSWVMEH